MRLLLNIPLERKVEQARSYCLQDVVSSTEPTLRERITSFLTQIHPNTSCTDNTGQLGPHLISSIPITYNKPHDLIKFNNSKFERVQRMFKITCILYARMGARD